MVKYLKKNRYRIFILILLFALSFVPVFERVTTLYIFKPIMAEYNLDLKIYQDRILTDLRLLEAHPIFENTTREKNAEWVISQNINWLGESNPTYNSINSLKIKKISKQYSGWRNNVDILSEVLQDPHLSELDTEWISRLEKYDHWNFSTHREVSMPLSLVQKVNSLTRVEIFSQLPVPDYNELRTWALVHFLKKAKAGELKQAYQDYRKVAELVHTSGTLIGNMSAASMLKDEYILLTKFKNPNWITKPYVSIDAYSRLSWAWIGLVKTAFFNNFPKEYWQYMKPENGVCASARESTANYSVFLDFFGSQFAFESDFSNNLFHSKKIFDRLNFDCNHSHYSGFLNRSPASTNPWTWSSIDINAGLFKNYSNMEFNFTVMDNWIYLPFVRRFVGLSFFMTGSPINYTVHYDSLPKKFPGIFNKAIY